MFFLDIFTSPYSSILHLSFTPYVIILRYITRKKRTLLLSWYKYEAFQCMNPLILHKICNFTDLCLFCYSKFQNKHYTTKCDGPGTLVSCMIQVSFLSSFFSGAVSASSFQISWDVFGWGMFNLALFHNHLLQASCKIWNCKPSIQMTRWKPKSFRKSRLVLLSFHNGFAFMKRIKESSIPYNTSLVFFGREYVWERWSSVSIHLSVLLANYTIFGLHCIRINRWNFMHCLKEYATFVPFWIEWEWGLRSMMCMLTWLYLLSSGWYKALCYLSLSCFFYA
jgi:hypothetical protein